MKGEKVSVKEGCFLWRGKTESKEKLDTDKWDLFFGHLSIFNDELCICSMLNVQCLDKVGIIPSTQGKGGRKND